MSIPPDPSPIPSHWQYAVINGIATATYNGNVASSGGTSLPVVTSLTALSDLNVASGAVYLNAGGRSGIFNSTSTDISQFVSIDTLQAVYIAFSTDPTGHSGGMVRQYDELLDTYFGDASTASLLAQLTFAIVYNVPLTTIQEYTSITPVDLSSLSGVLNWTVLATLMQAANQSSKMINFGSITVNIDGFDIGIIDGNESNQSSWNAECIYIGFADAVEIENITFQNMKKSGLHIDAPVNKVEVSNVIFKDGAVASGIVDEYCAFFICRGGIDVKVSLSRFIQSADPVGTAVRQPAGFSMINTGATEIEGTLVIDQCFFSNLGLNTNSSGNLLAPCDFYSISINATVKYCYFEKSRYIAIRVCHGRIQNIENNYIDQGVPLLFDGGGAFLNAACIFAGATDRGYLLDSNDAYSINIRGNVVVTYNNINASGIFVSNTTGSNAYVRSTLLENNDVICNDTNAYNGIYLNGLYNATLIGGWINNFTIGVRAVNTSLAAPISNELYTTLSIKGTRLSGNPTGIYAALNVANLNISIESVDITGATNQSLLIISALNVRVKACNLGGNAGEVQTCASFVFEDNNAGIASDPTGYTTNTYYRLANNVGRNDEASIDFNRGAPTASSIPTVSGNIGDKVYNSAPAHSGFIGWVCLGGTSWATYGAIT